MAKRRKKADLDESYGLMFGFLNDEPEVTAFLQIVQDGEELYDFVFDERDATQFPFVNNAQIKGFATPDKWLEYFNKVLAIGKVENVCTQGFKQITLCVFKSSPF